MGAVMQSGGDTEVFKNGQQVVIGGLMVQLIALAWFLLEYTILLCQLQTTTTCLSVGHHSPRSALKAIRERNIGDTEEGAVMLD
ncbi:RTA1 domain protein [Penicillium lividum]|nr:RTA1 domain protein [Penicillium lividum]